MPGEMARYLPEARRDIDQITRYIAADDLSAALAFADAVTDAVGRIIDHPRIGPAYPVNNPRLAGLRKLNLGGRFRRYLIFYLLRDAEVLVVRVLDGSRDLDVLLAESPAEEQ